MVLDFSPAALINGGSGLLYIAVGVLILVLARVKMARALAGYCIAFGAGFVVINVLGADLVSIGLWVRGLTSLVAGGFLVWLHFTAPWRDGASRRAIVAAGATALLLGIVRGALASNPAYLAVAQVGGYADPVASQVASAAGAALFAAAAFVGFAAALARPRMTIAAALLMVGILAYSAYNDFNLLSHPLIIGRPDFVAIGVPVTLGIVLVGLAWLPSSRIPAWGLLGIGLVAMLANVFLTDFAGTVGIVRCLAAVLIVFAVLRHDLLDTPLSAPKVRRGGLATGALALLFIVAQIAQNFFSAQYGLLTGGIVAGAFLVAANPIQKRIERMGESNARTEPARGRRVDAEEAYKVALRKFLADGRTSPEEEVALATLADGLGLTTRRTVELRQSVLNEIG